MITLHEIQSTDEFESVLTSIKEDEEVIIFKASPRCSVSLNIERFFTRWFEQQDKNGLLKAYKVDVVNRKEVSNFISQKTGIKHESPQLLWFSSANEIKWHGSHFGINEQELNSLL